MRHPWKLAVLSLAAAAIAGAARAGETFDWCASIVVRPDSRHSDDCRPVWPPGVIAGGADLVLIGSGLEVAQPKIDALEGSCFGPLTHRRAASYVKQLRDLSAARGRKLTIVHLSRFDLVSPDLAALPGFDAAFLLRTDRPWSEVEAFYTADRSPACADGDCRLLDSAPNDRRHVTIAGFIEKVSQAKGASRRAVYYLGRPSAGQREHWPLAAVADLRNQDYRRWRVAEAKRALEVGGYDLVELNQKFHQYRPAAPPAPPGHWIGNGGIPDVTALDALGDTYFTAPPAGYGYPEYVAGWGALADDLRAAGVPYEVNVNAGAWGTFYDDPATPDRDEARTIRNAALGADLVLLMPPGPNAAALQGTAEAELRAAGVRFVPYQPACGFGTPGDVRGAGAPRDVPPAGR